MLLNITHATRYDYDQPVDYALQQVRLHPLSNPLQDVGDWQLHVEGGQIETSYCDHFGNYVHLVSATPGTQSLKFTAEGSATTRGSDGVLGQVYGRAPLGLFLQPTETTKPGDSIAEIAKTVGAAGTLLDGLHNLSAAILDRVPYRVGKTTATTSAEEAIGIGHGVCQDHANIFISAARKAGVPARYVSGYLFMPDRVDQDASHAWAEVHLPDLGWVGFDVSNGVAPDEKYLRIAIGRDAQDAAPIAGIRQGPGSEAMIVSLQIQQ